ncbi:FxSxx-COOH system tetratricopeptide repeat protein [Nonomuraea sp. JJY05]|uniref:FxSxx-COOH system tetratricopeptide repeat protein n=1 Tax=Nonomuraea sp. JJY05 TaxID=3350255 RepID=UPI00373F5180
MEAPEALVGLPRRPVAAFVGREHALSVLRDALVTGPGIISQAIVGLGGVGKSELALQYAHRHRADYRLMWWMEADSPAQIQAGLAGLTRAMVAGIDSVAAEQATTEEAAAWALAWLSSRTGWLVVFDNVEETTHIDPYLARLSRGHVLITTRRDIGWQHLGITPVRLDLLDRQASVDLLADLIGPPAEGQAKLLDELALRLGDLPLALTQAGAYITRTPRVTPARYLHLLTDAPARIHAAAPVGGDAARVVAKVWALSHQRIGVVNPLAVHLLKLLACYAPDNLPITVLDGLDETNELAVDEALALLASYSMITITAASQKDSRNGEEELVNMHRLTQAAVWHQLPAAQRDHYRQVAASLLENALPDDPELAATWPRYALLLSHARFVLTAQANGMRKIARYLGVSGDYRTAKALYQEIFDNTRANLGSEHPITLTARSDLARWTGWTGDATAARDQLAALLPVEERVLGAEHPQTLLTRHNLARWTGDAGDAVAARDQFAALLPIRERVLGAEHSSTLATRHNLARWTGQAGDATAARDQLIALLPIRERVLGAEHPDTLTTRHNLGCWIGNAGDAAEARDQFAALLPVEERILGIEHPSTLATRHNLARWTGQAGDATAARDQLIALLPIRERVLGAEHPDTLTTRHELARWTGWAGDATAARDQLTALLPVRQRVSGVNHPDTRSIRVDLTRWTDHAP